MIKRRGFTLIELLLYVSIMGVMIFSFAGMLSIIMQSRVKNDAIMEVEEQGAQAMHTMTQAVRNATAISVPVVASSSSELSVHMPAAGSSPTIFEVFGGALRIREGTASAIPLTNARVVVSDLLFTNLSRMGTPGTIRIQFTLTHVNPSGRNEYEYTKIFYDSATIR